DHLVVLFFLLFYFNDPSTTDIYTLSLHDALPISAPTPQWTLSAEGAVQRSLDVGKSWQKISVANGTTFRALCAVGTHVWAGGNTDRKSTRLNSSHVSISYAVFCLKKKTKQKICQ